MSLAGVAAAPFDVEAEPAGVVVPQLRLVSRGERLADLVERLQVRDRVRPGGPRQRRLVEEHDIGDFAADDQLGIRGGRVGVAERYDAGARDKGSPRPACSCPSR